MKRNKSTGSGVMLGGMEISSDNPFLDDIRNMLKASKEVNRTYHGNGALASESLTVTMKREYLPFPFTKVFQSKELLQDLDPWACKVLIHIALNLPFGSQHIKMNYKLVGMDQRKYNKTLLELMLRRIIVREKPGCFWVNITLLVVGNITTDRTHAAPGTHSSSTTL